MITYLSSGIDQGEESKRGQIYAPCGVRTQDRPCLGPCGRHDQLYYSWLLLRNQKLTIYIGTVANTI